MSVSTEPGKGGFNEPTLVLVQSHSFLGTRVGGWGLGLGVSSDPGHLNWGHLEAPLVVDFGGFAKPLELATGYLRT